LGKKIGEVDRGLKPAVHSDLWTKVILAAGNKTPEKTKKASNTLAPRAQWYYWHKYKLNCVCNAGIWPAVQKSICIP